MTPTLRSAAAAFALCTALAGCGGGDDGGADDAGSDPTAEESLSLDGDWVGTMDETDGEVTFFVDGEDLEYFEAVIPHCDPGYTEDKAFTQEDFEIAADGTVSGTVEDEYGGMGSTFLTLDAVFDGDTLTGTLDWQGTADCTSQGLAFTAQRQ